MALGADLLECDVTLTLDEVPVCIHDATVDRTTGGTRTGRVDGYTLAQLRAMDFGAWFDPQFAGARIVPLEEQLDCYLRHNRRARFHLEIKDSAEGRAEQVLAGLLARKGLDATGNRAGGNVRSSTVIVQSFQAASLQRIRALSPDLPTAFLYSSASGTAGQWQLLGDGPDYIDVFAPADAVIAGDPMAVQRFHGGGHDVHVWTVNDSARMAQLLDLGVDAIFTDRPDLLRAEIDAAGTGTSPAERGNPSSFAAGCPGVAGRVVSNGGPGDVWAADGNRGVKLVQPYPPPEDGGALGDAVLAALLAAAWLRRRLIS